MLSRDEKFHQLERLNEHDAEAVEAIIDDCIAHRWPQTPEEWFAVAERISTKH